MPGKANKQSPLLSLYGVAVTTGESLEKKMLPLAKLTQGHKFRKNEGIMKQRDSKYEEEPWTGIKWKLYQVLKQDHITETLLAK